MSMAQRSQDGQGHCGECRPAPAWPPPYLHSAQTLEFTPPPAMGSPLFPDPLCSARGGLGVQPVPRGAAPQG